jgi:hypothetical protein
VPDSNIRKNKEKAHATAQAFAGDRLAGGEAGYPTMIA